MLLHKVLIKDGFYYYRKKANDTDKSQCSKEEYKNYFVNRQRLKDLLNIKQSTAAAATAEGSQQQLETINKVIEDQLDFIKSHYYHRVRKYKANKHSQLFWELFKNK